MRLLLKTRRYILNDLGFIRHVVIQQLNLNILLLQSLPPLPEASPFGGHRYDVSVFFPDVDTTLLRDAQVNVQPYMSKVAGLGFEN